MIIVQGVFRIAPEDRERYLADSLETQRISRGERGCIEYVFAADPLEADRVVLSERWETRADLDAHLEALAARRASAGENATGPVSVLARDVSLFEASEVEGP